MEQLRERLEGSAAGPYVSRLLEDPELRASIRDAALAARGLYSELRGPKTLLGTSARLAADPRLRRQVRDLSAGVKDASLRLQGREPEPVVVVVEDHSKRDLVLWALGLAALGILAYRRFSADA